MSLAAADAFAERIAPEVEVEPESWEKAKAERDALISDMKDIDTQLADPMPAKDGRRLTREERDEWRKRAIWARRFKERRATYLKHWMATHPRPFVTGEPTATVVHRIARGSVSTTNMMRAVAKRIGFLESV